MEGHGVTYARRVRRDVEDEVAAPFASARVDRLQQELAVFPVPAHPAQRYRLRTVGSSNESVARCVPSGHATPNPRPGSEPTAAAISTWT
jgi:hypothetical protein